MTRYQEFATTVGARAKEREIWGSYYQRECARRGLTAGVDSLDSFRGRTLQLSRAVTDSSARARVVASVPILEVDGTETELSGLAETSTLVDRAALSQPVRDALDAEDASSQTRLRAGQ